MKKAALILCLVVSFLYGTAQTKTGTIKGTVTTSDGNPVHEVNVLIKQLNRYSSTNEKGVFNFKNVPYGRYTIVYSFAEIEPQAVEVTVPPSADAVTTYQLPVNTHDLQEVVITSARSPNRAVATVGKAGIAIMDMPQAVTIINRSAIENQQAQRLSDVVKNVNGVYLAGARAGTQETFYGRGYNLGANNMFRNGFRINSGAMPEMSSLESVEILKGANAILYGNVAPGGIINMVSKKPKFDFGGDFTVRTGSFGLIKPSLDVYGALTKFAAFRLNGTFEKTDSYRDVVHSDRLYVNPSLLFELSPRTDLIIQADYLQHKFTPDFGIGSLDGKTIAAVPRSRFMGADWQYAKTRQATVSTELNHQFNKKLGLNAGVAYQNYERDYYALERIQADAAGKWKRPLGKTNNLQNFFTGQVNLTGKMSTGAIGHQFLIGADASRDIAKNLASNITGKIYDSINLLDQNMYVRRTDIPEAHWITRTNIPITSFGAYIQDVISLTQKLKLLAGVRWSYQQAEASKIDSLIANKYSLGKQQIDRAFSPRIGLVYQPLKTLSLFASYANTFSPNSGFDINNNALRASVIDQYELGLKNDFMEGRLSTNLTLYKIINNNLAQMVTILPDGTPNSNTQLRELTGQTTSDGIEADIRAIAIKGLEFIAGYSYNNMRYTKTSGKTGSYVQGQRLVNSPAHTGNITAFYSFCVGVLKNLKLGAGYYYTGERWGGWNNTYTNNNGVVTDRLIPVGAFGTFDLSAGYHYRKISLMAKLANITNSYNYYVHENYSINPIPPRNFVITASFKF